MDQLLINVEVGINVEGGIFWKKLVHKCNKLRGVEGGKSLRNQWCFFFKISKGDFTFIREARVIVLVFI